jgi:uncharacterized protein
MSQNVKTHQSDKVIQEDREPIILKNNGQKIFCVFHKPAHQSSFPVVFFCHGLAGHKTGRYRIYVELATQLLKLGIASFRLDFRGSGDSEGEFSDMTIAGEVSDALVGLNFLKEHPNVDPARIGIFGRSMGGAIAMMAASRFNDIRSICLWSPVYHAKAWESKWNFSTNSPADHTHPQDLLIEGQIPGLEFMKEFVNMNLEKDILNLQNVPLLLIHGNQDKLVPADNSDLYLKARMEAEAETKFIQLPKSDHHFSPLDERKIALDETTQWFKTTL